MFGLLPRVLFWLALILVPVAANFPQPLSLPVPLDDNALRILVFAVLSVLAVWAYPFTRLVPILLGLVLFAGLLEVMNTIPEPARDTDAFFNWSLAVATIVISMIVIAMLRKLVPPLLALPAPGPERNVWKRYALLPTLVLGIFLAGTALADRTGRLDLSVSEMLPVPIRNFANPAADSSYVQRFALPEASPMSGGAKAGIDQMTIDSPLDPSTGDDSTLGTALNSPEALTKSAQLGPDSSSAAADGGLLAVDFDLGGRPGARDAIQIRKPVSLAGAEMGQLSLRIDENSQLYADLDQVEALLPGATKSVKDVKDGFVSFQELRRAGIPIRYDVGKDQIVLTGS